MWVKSSDGAVLAWHRYLQYFKSLLRRETEVGTEAKHRIERTSTHKVTRAGGVATFPLSYGLALLFVDCFSSPQDLASTYNEHKLGHADRV